MEKGHYPAQTLKLKKNLNQYLGKLEKSLEARWGLDKTSSIIKKAKVHYPEIIMEMPFFNTPMYDSLVLTCSRMLALKKAMKDEGIDVEEFVAFSIKDSREKSNRIPAMLRSIGGWIFLSKPLRIYLKRVARSCSANGWPTEVIDGGKSDNFDMKICTRDCGMVGFLQALGEDDLIPYCTFFDFTTAEAMGLGLKHVSSIDTGECVYCFDRSGKVEWPESIRSLLGEY
ncbi:hypothetical protein ACFLYX_01455 [Chloroflexota bacterium]